MFLDRECPRCGRRCGNGGSGFTVRCVCGWVGSLSPEDEAVISEIIERHKRRNGGGGDAE